jgi:hypothetical protein
LFYLLYESEADNKSVKEKAMQHAARQLSPVQEADAGLSSRKSFLTVQSTGCCGVTLLSRLSSSSKTPSLIGSLGFLEAQTAKVNTPDTVHNDWTKQAFGSRPKF